MSTAVEPREAHSFVIHFGPVLQKLNDEDFFEFCRLNSAWRIERTKEGDVIFMAPTGSETGARNFDLIGSFYNWVRTDGTGKGFDSSTGFTLPNGAVRSPDLAWVRLPRWTALSAVERRQFSPLCPDFVVELRSESDQLDELQAKMQEYIDNGAQLGWLIDPLEKKVYVYSAAAQVECLNDPKTVSGDPLLPGFVLDLGALWT